MVKPPKSKCSAFSCFLMFVGCSFTLDVKIIHVDFLASHDTHTHTHTLATPLWIYYSRILRTKFHGTGSMWWWLIGSSIQHRNTIEAPKAVVFITILSLLDLNEHLKLANSVFRKWLASSSGLFCTDTKKKLQRFRPKYDANWPNAERKVIFE